MQSGAWDSPGFGLAKRDAPMRALERTTSTRRCVGFRYTYAADGIGVSELSYP
jgi:hypothetical protein